MKKVSYIITVLLMLCCASACHQPQLEAFPDASMSIGAMLSNQTVNTFAEDSEGYIWIGTARGLNRYNGHEYHRYFANPEDSLSLTSNSVTALLCDSKQRLWVGTINGLNLWLGEDKFCQIPIDLRFRNVTQLLETSDGRILVNLVEQLCEYIPETGELRILIEDFDPEHAYINACLLDEQGNLWSLTRHSIRCFDTSAMELKHSFSIPFEPEYTEKLPPDEVCYLHDGKISIFNLHEGKFQPTPSVINTHPLLSRSSIVSVYAFGTVQLLMQTDRGLFIYDRLTGQVTGQDEKGFPFLAPKHDITHLFIDSHDNLWLGQGNQGFQIVNQSKGKFTGLPTLRERLQGHAISSMSADGHQHIWLATHENELFVYDERTAQLTQLSTSGLFKKQQPNAIPFTIHADQNRRLWIINEGKLHECSYANGKLTLRQTHDEIAEIVSSINSGPHGDIWIGTNTNRLYQLPPGATVFSPIDFDVTSMFTSFQLMPLSNGHIVLGSAFNNPVYLNPATGTLYRIPVVEDISNFNLATAFMEDPQGQIWIGTQGIGAYRYDPVSQVSTYIDGLACEEITDILSDDLGNVWISTQNGLSCVNADDLSVSNYTMSDGTGGNQYATGCAVRLSDGQLLFGGTHGLTVVDPAIQTEAHSMPLVFEDLRVNNQVMRLDASQPLNLSHDSRQFSVAFSPLNYQENEQTHHFYKLEGFNDQWVDIHNSHEIYFSNIPAGHYTLHVRAADHDQRHTLAENDLIINISPAWWNTWWARLAYLLILAGIAYVIIRYRRQLSAEKRAAERLEQEKKQEQRVNEMNMRYFANVSHEFRTPLTMIAGPADQLSQDETLKPTERRLVQTIQLNARRMLRLVNQQMDFHKLENDSLKLQVRQTDLTALMRQTISLFEVNMQEKEITLQTFGLEEEVWALADADMIEKVLVNLFSNALKYTPREGTISCGISNDGNMVTFIVADNGVSIPEDKLERIFERYYQVENPRNYGTGIGLYFVRRLLTLHHGTISAGNLPEGGVQFQVTLPANDVYAPEEHATGEQSQAALYPLGLTEVPSAKTTYEHSQTVMVVDDDPDIVNYLRLLLTPHYRLFHAYDAASALESIRGEMPDLVMSDVAMPGMDGYQLCQTLKEDLTTCHIPVILVTAKTTTEEQIAGLNTGADAYVTKPFNPDYLLALIRSQLSNRERIRGILSQSTKVEAQAEQMLNTQDKQFMDELYTLMEQELSNPELNINSLTERLLMSRSKLNYKIKGLTGETPASFFRRFKLNKAAEMLREGSHSVSEVADLTGFSSPTVFSRNFKQQFGVTPSEFVSDAPQSQHPA